MGDTTFGTPQRRALNKVIFAKLYVDDGHVTAHTLNGGLAELIEAGQPASRRYLRRAPLSSHGWGQNETSPIPEDEADDSSTEAGLLDMILSGHGSNRSALVELTGLRSTRPPLLDGPDILVSSHDLQDRHDLVTSADES